MFVIKMVGVLACICALIWAIYNLETYCARVFQHRFFTVRAFVISSIAFTMILVGHWLYVDAQTTQTDDLNGLALMVVGSMLGVALCVWNMQRSTIPLGFLGSLLHAGLFAAIGQLGAIALLVSFACWAYVISLHAVKRTKDQPDEEY
ncbi:MAG: hypothetical protein RL701_2544 [Pseudomonadota bacterium]|jgi:hypothetical protein